MVNMNRIRRIYLPLLGLLWLVPALATAPLDREAEKEKMRELGRQNDSAWSLYQSLKQAAGGGKRLNWEQLPDWSGLYTKTRGGLKFDSRSTGRWFTHRSPNTEIPQDIDGYDR